MASEQRRLLEQLMGTSRTPSSTKYSDATVCRSYLVGTCPHDLFTNTKQDLGSCPKLHSEPLKTAYEADKAAGKDPGYEWDYARDLQKYVEECNRRIDAAQRRLEKTPEEIMKTNQLLKGIGELERSIQVGLQEVEVLGEMGSVGLALEEYVKVKKLKFDKDEKERELKSLSDTSGPSGHQKLQVCDVCGAYLSRLDNDRRLADHFYGKMHLGYAQMRNKLKELQEVIGNRRPPAGDGGAARGAGGEGGWGNDRGFGGDYGDRRERRGGRGDGGRRGGRW
ncbi:U1 snRNP-associated protein usp106 [Drechslerella stenobrocha 248]|uniref:U1 snRNP-associated protein usp106 n=1 Tax=Drechslerella stenobrocha 248 TaxID=1043628 RepID=W7IBB9_9PEZI|nr:U1 snRNP-associated protein usp106 [Drechslerella stenobrocha 248]